MRTHELKIEAGPLISIVEGKKTSEYRKNDRDFCVGDILVLRRFDPATGVLSEHHGAIAKVSHVQRGGTFGIPNEFCVLSFRLLHGQ